MHKIGVKRKVCYLKACRTKSRKPIVKLNFKSVPWKISLKRPKKSKTKCASDRLK